MPIQSLRNFTTKHLTVKIPYWVALLIPFLAYAFWEYYWYKQLGYRFIKWHTFLMPYISLMWIITILITILPQKLFSDRVAKKYLLSMSVLLGLLLAELALMILGWTDTYMEKMTGYYYGAYEQINDNYYYTWPLGQSEHYLKKPEYNYWRPTNVLGFPDKEWNEHKDSNTTRILALGDSFTEGDGASVDSSYPALLNKLMYASNANVEVMNAGMCSSDPFYEYILLRDKLIQYKPDIVLLAIGSDDITQDYSIRGGLERFDHENQKVKYRQAPWWEPLYACSHLFRLYIQNIGYNESLINSKSGAYENTLSLKAHTELLSMYDSLLAINGSKMVLIFRPNKYEFIEGRYSYNWDKLKSATLKLENIGVIDLMPGYLQTIKNTQNSPSDYYWKIDGHHNALGYQLMAHCIWDSLQTKLKLSRQR